MHIIRTTPRALVAVLGAGAPLAGSASAASIVRGTTGDDTLTGTARADLIKALAGDDTVTGQDGDDTIFAGPGRDTIDGGAGDDRLWAKAAVDVVALGDEEGDVVTGGAGDDRIHVRDGERDDVTCGDGEDMVVADQFDSVADDCEVVHRKDVTDEQAAAAKQREQAGAKRRHGRGEQVKQKLQDRLQRRAARRA